MRKIEIIQQRPAEPTLGLIRALRKPRSEELLEAAKTFRRSTAFARTREGTEGSLSWDHIQILPAQLATKPLPEKTTVLAKVELRDHEGEKECPPLVVAGGALKGPELRLSVTEDELWECRGGTGSGVKGMLVEGDAVRSGLEAAAQSSASFVVLDGKQPFAALAELRRWKQGASTVLPVFLLVERAGPAEFIKAMGLGADGVVLSSNMVSRIQALEVDTGAPVNNFILSSTILMKVMARACGHDSFAKFGMAELTSWHYEMAKVSRVAYSGVGEKE